MKQLTFLRKETVKWQEAAEPTIKSPDAAIVRPFVAGRCDGDSVFLFHNYTRAIRIGVAVHFLDPKVLSVFGKRPFQGPIPVGHECIAEVVETGEAVTRFQKGDVVVVPWAISCGTCPVCSDHLYSHCRNNPHPTPVAAYGFGEATGGWGGMVSDYVLVPFADRMLTRLPAGVDPLHAASLSDNITDAYRTVGPFLENGEKSPVLVMGGSCKSIGLYAVGMAKALGSAQVDYVDHDRERLEIAESFGANAVEVPEGSVLFKSNVPLLKDGYPVTVDASNSVRRLQYAIKSLAFGGTCTSTGFFFRSGTPLPLWEMYLKSATLKVGISHPLRDIPKALDLMMHKGFQPQKVTTLLAYWEQAEEAYLAKTTKLILHRRPLYSSL
ncbi:zinc-dependent alcohol dehydrogenase [Larkinella soli]|uniref:zinc-dependent alcohol dehydrogenase n=1 Tax=Larkinella soli TaxID=1770527 RepID=UPI000FFC647A|nr:alcohol dehydrogenase catalytic domain-containing protein [Larkinella soli]